MKSEVVRLIDNAWSGISDKLHIIDCPNCHRSVYFNWNNKREGLYFVNSHFEYHPSDIYTCEHCGTLIEIDYGKCSYTVFEKPQKETKSGKIWSLALFDSEASNYFGYRIFKAENPSGKPRYLYYISIAEDRYREYPIFITYKQAMYYLHHPYNALKDIEAYIREEKPGHKGH